jgi:hypothetical protein
MEAFRICLRVGDYSEISRMFQDYEESEERCRDAAIYSTRRSVY